MGKEQFIGSWKLVSSEWQRSDGKVSYPLGKDAKGIITYDAAGYVATQLMSMERPTFVSGDHLKGTLEEMKAAFQGTMTYYGPYEINEKDHVIVHKVEGSLFPNWEGLSLKRFYEFSGDRLTLSTPPMTMGGVRVTGVLIWKRAKPLG